MLNSLVLIMILFFSRNLYAKCELKISSLSPIIFNGIDGAQVKKTRITVTRHFYKNKNECRRFYITLNEGVSGSYRPRHMMNENNLLAYNIYKKKNLKSVIFHHPYAYRRSRVIRGHFSPKENKTSVVFWAKILNHSEFVKTVSGNYHDVLVARLYNGRFPYSGHKVYGSSILNIRTYLPPSIDISLVSTGAPFDVNDTYEHLGFGALKEGKVKAFDLRVMSNTSYKILFSSQNNGKLKEATSKSSINYDLFVNGQKKSLKNSSSYPVEIARGRQTHGHSGLFPVKVKIKKTRNKRAGFYQDIILIETIAQ